MPDGNLYESLHSAVDFIRTSIVQFMIFNHFQMMPFPTKKQFLSIAPLVTNQSYSFDQIYRF
jgi:hypothetical protein